MIKEFAIQPEVMATWAHFRELRDDFGIGRGRLISVFPWDWKARVEKLSQEQNQDIKAAAILNHLHSYLYQGDPCFIHTRTSPCKSQDDWLEKAEQSTTPAPFHAIISTANPRKQETVLVAGAFERNTVPFAVRTQIDVPRQPEALAESCGLLLQNCDEFRLVDPHFDAIDRAYANTFKALLEALDSQGRRISRLEIHVPCSEQFNKDYQQGHYTRAFARFIGKQNTLRVVCWRDLPQGFHARYLLTELGGVKFDWGFSQGNSPDHLNEVLLLEHARYLEIEQRYRASDSPSPERFESFQIHGARLF